MKRLQNTGNSGLRALIRANGLEGEITPYHVGFVIGSCLNASGETRYGGKSTETSVCGNREEAAAAGGRFEKFK